MFCQKCGSSIAETATACPSCHAPVARAAAGAAAAAMTSTVKANAMGAFAAFKSFAGNPVGGLAPTCEALGEAKARSVGMTFGVVTLLCFLVGGIAMQPWPLKDMFDIIGFGGFMKCVLFGAMPFLSVMVGSLAVRKVFGGQGSSGADAFIAGASLLPAAFAMLLGSFLGVGNYEVIAILYTFAACLAVMMLFAGYTRIARLTDRAGSLAVPIVVLLSAWLSKIVLTSIMSGSFGGSSGVYGGFNY